MRRIWSFITRCPLVLLFSAALLLASCATPGAAGRSGSLDPLPEKAAALFPGAQAPVLLPEAGPAFWRSIMTPEVAQEYRAVGGRTQCTRYVGDVLEARFGPEVYRAVFPSGPRGANETFLDWAENPQLIRLDPKRFNVADIQGMADAGILILMAYYYTGVAGHVAFVGHGDLDLFTVPPLNGLEGMNGRALESDWLPVMVQAGTYTGVTSMVYATNGWLTGRNFAEGTVRYYLVRRP